MLEKVFFWRKKPEPQPQHVCVRCGDLLGEQIEPHVSADMFRFGVQKFYGTAATVWFEWPDGKEYAVAVTVNGGRQVLDEWLEKEANRVFARAGYPNWRQLPTDP